MKVMSVFMIRFVTKNATLSETKGAQPFYRKIQNSYSRLLKIPSSDFTSQAV